MKNAILFILLFSPLMACNKNAPNPKLLKQEFNIKKNQIVKIKDGSIVISLKLIEINDSRCPSDVTCVRAGEAIVKFEIEFSGFPKKTLQLCRDCVSNLGIGTSIPVTNGKQNYIIGIIAVNPYPKSTNQNVEKMVSMVVD